MSDVQTVSMIGLGAMGSALARAIAKNGHDLTVLNRSDAKCRPLAAEGASVASSVGEAVSGPMSSWSASAARMITPEEMDLMSPARVQQLKRHSRCCGISMPHLCHGPITSEHNR